MRTYSVKGWPYGLRNKGMPAILDDREMRSCLNIDLDKKGIPETRGGSEELCSATVGGEDSAVNSIFQFKDENGTRHLLTTNNTKVCKYNNVDDYSDITNGNTQTYTAATRYCYTRATLSNRISIAIGTNNVDTPFYYNPAEDGILPISYGPDKAKSVVWYNNRLLFGNIHKSGYRSSNEIIYSDDRAPLQISVDNNLFVGAAGDEIVAMVEAMDYLAILKEDSVWRLEKRSQESIAYAPVQVEVTPFEVKNVVHGIGCIAPASVAVFGAFIFFVGRDGMYLWDVRGTNEDDVRQIDLKINWDDRLNDRLSEIHATTHLKRGQIRVWVPEGDSDNTNNTISTFYSIHPQLYDRRSSPYQPAWTKNEFKGNCSFAGVDADEESVVFVGDFDGKIQRLDDGTFNDNDTTIQSYFITGEIDCGTDRRKTFNEAKITGPSQTNSTIEVSQYINFGDLIAIEDIDFADSTGRFPINLPFTFGSGVYVSEDMILGGSDVYTSFRFMTNTVNHGFGISSIVLGFDIAS